MKTFQATELGPLLSGARALDRSCEDITVFDMTGLALQDLTVAASVYQRATEQGLGTQVLWPWLSAARTPHLQKVPPP